MSSIKQQITIFGATGPVGTSLCEQASQAHPEWNIQAVSRNPNKDSRLKSMNLSNVTLVDGDVMSKETVLSLTEKSDIIFSSIGFPHYTTKYWAEHWPIVVDNLLEAVQKGDKKKKLVFCDNLYAYGNPAPDPIRTDTKLVKASLKGKPYIRSY